MMANVDSKTDVSVPVRVPNAKFFVGNKVKVNTNVLNVRGTPSAFGKFLGAQTLGVVGDIVGGPVLATGYTWWQINYATAPSGWSAENWLEKAPGSAWLQQSSPSTYTASALQSIQLQLNQVVEQLRLILEQLK